MGTRTYTITNPKKIKDFKENLKLSARYYLRDEKQVLKNFSDDNPQPCVFCDKLTTWGLGGIGFGAPICPVCAERENGEQPAD